MCFVLIFYKEDTECITQNIMIVIHNNTISLASLCNSKVATLL